MTNPTNARSTEEEMLQAWDLPNPFDPTICTTHVAGDYLTEAQTITRNVHVPLGSADEVFRDAARAVSIYLKRCAVVTEVWEQAVNGPSDVQKSGWSDEGQYGWAVDSVPHDDRKTPFTVVTWTDGVANDWVQIVRDQAHADRFLQVLAHVVKHSENLTENWEEDAPTDCTGWKVDTQISVRVVLNADGSPERVEVPMTFDPDFINGVIGPDGTVYGDECHSGSLPDLAADVWRQAQGGEVYAPHID